MFQRLPRLFGGYARNRILFTLALKGPQRRRELSRAADVDPQQTLEIVRLFARTGAIIYHPGKWKPIELNPRFCVASHLQNLILKIAEMQLPNSMPSLKAVKPTADVLELFGNRSRSLVLMELANGPSVKTTTTIMAATSLTEQSVTAAVKYLERDAIVTSFVKCRARCIAINVNFSGSPELRELLMSLRAAVSDSL